MQAAFFYNSGPPSCHVPNLVGMLLRKAVVRIAHAHWTPDRVIRRRSSKARKNHVLAQSPRPGNWRFPGERINLTGGERTDEKVAGLRQ
jgi:beta-lactam-binding protein with PASTA domain